MTVFIEWILKYWLQVLFGLICAGVALFWKRIKTWRQTYKDKEQEKLKDAIVETLTAKFEECSKRSDENDKAIQAELDLFKVGLLSVQGAQFRASCRELLQEGRYITLDDFELLSNEHKTYNSLGGNSVGDELFQIVKTKFENQQTQGK